MGMDYAFLSTSEDLAVAHEYMITGSRIGGGPGVLFEVVYLSTCPGADVSALSIFPGRRRSCSRPAPG